MSESFADLGLAECTFKESNKSNLPPHKLKDSSRELLLLPLLKWNSSRQAPKGNVVGFV